MKSSIDLHCVFIEVIFLLILCHDMKSSINLYYVIIFQLILCYYIKSSIDLHCVIIKLFFNLYIDLYCVIVIKIYFNFCGVII